MRKTSRSSVEPRIQTQFTFQTSDGICRGGVPRYGTSRSSISHMVMLNMYTSDFAYHCRHDVPINVRNSKANTGIMHLPNIFGISWSRGPSRELAAPCQRSVTCASAVGRVISQFHSVHPDTCLADSRGKRTFLAESAPVGNALERPKSDT